jgi:two-component system sensor histidine kinase KdpD
LQASFRAAAPCRVESDQQPFHSEAFGLGNATAQQSGKVTRALLLRAGEGLIAVAVATVVGLLPGGHLSESDRAMVMLLAVFWSAYRGPFAVACFSALVAVTAFNFFFVYPTYTFEFADSRYLVTFTVMAIVGAASGWLVHVVRRQSEAARRYSDASSLLSRWTDGLAAGDNERVLAQATTAMLLQSLQIHSAVVLDGDPLRTVAAAALDPLCTETDTRAVARCIERSAPTGASTRTLAGAGISAFPLAGQGGVAGALCVEAGAMSADAAIRALLASLALQLGLAMSRVQAEREQRSTELTLEREQIRGALLAAVSHDLRTPLGAILGASTTLVDHPGLAEPARSELLESIASQARRLERHISNLLDMTRITAGDLRAQLVPDVVPELIGDVVSSLAIRTGAVDLRVVVDEDAELAVLDATLMRSALQNLIENAIRFGGDAGPIEVHAYRAAHEIVFEVVDRGPGVPENELAGIFEAFQRSSPNRDDGGKGLGLAIVTAVAALHEGRAWAWNRKGGGLGVAIAIPAVAVELDDSPVADDVVVDNHATGGDDE